MTPKWRLPRKLLTYASWVSQNFNSDTIQFIYTLYKQLSLVRLFLPCHILYHLEYNIMMMMKFVHNVAPGFRILCPYCVYMYLLCLKFNTHSYSITSCLTKHNFAEQNNQNGKLRFFHLFFCFSKYYVNENEDIATCWAFQNIFSHI